MNCCTISPEQTKADAERIATEKAMMDKTFTLNGVTLAIKDMFPDCWSAKEFVTKLNLLEKSAGGKALLDTSPMSIMDDEEGND